MNFKLAWLPFATLFLLGAVLYWAPVFAPDFAFVQKAAGQAQEQTQEPETGTFETGTLFINTAQGRFEFSIEIADDDEERSRGLMFRETMPTKHGMLFDFEGTRRIQMWMRNTPLSLDMIFIQPDGKVAHIAERTTPFSDAIIDSTVPVSHVLEVNAGISRLIGLEVGDTIDLP